MGVGRDVLGMSFGMGLKPRVVMAYQFLLENYRSHDRIHIFGFSRGAFQARVLAALLHHAGLPTKVNTSHAAIAETVFDAVKTSGNSFTSHRDRQHAVRKALALEDKDVLSSVVVDTLRL